jgi:hypothetical protein
MKKKVFGQKLKAIVHSIELRIDGSVNSGDRGWGNDETTAEDRRCGHMN